MLKSASTYWLSLSLGIISLFVNSNISAQGCCSGGVPISGGLSLSGTEKGLTQFLLSYEYNNLQDLVSGTRKLNDNTRERKTHSMLLEFSYNLSEKFSFSLLNTYIWQTRKINTIHREPEITIANGLGDGVFLFKYNILPLDSIRLIISIGIGPKFPIGVSDINGNIGTALPADLQPGSGSWDLILWNYISKEQIFNSLINVGILTTYRFTGENPKYLNRQTFAFGDEFQLTTNVNRSFTIKSLFINAYLGLRYRQVEPNEIDGNIVGSTGGKWLDFLPGIGWLANPNFTMKISAQVPVYRSLIETQLSTTYRASITAHYKLSPKKKKMIFNQ